jgi:glucosamine-6-phosphate isomerase
MKITVLDSYEKMSGAAADFITAHVQQNPNSLLCFGSGDTPTGTLKKLVDYTGTGKVDFKHCLFVGLDEWVGMDRYTEGSCQHYVYSNFFNPLKIDHGKITFFNAMANDLDVECKRIDQYLLDNGPIDLLLLGVGVNGHIGLNEPGTPFDSNCHTIDLEDSTKKTAQKYFSGSKALQEGITLGLAHLMRATTVVLIANGIKKASILHRVMEGPVSENVPGSILQRHPNCHCFADKEAASLLKTS